MGIRIIYPGVLTTIQDYGRAGYCEIGISPSGAVDIPAMETANILVGNHMGEGVLECTLYGPSVIFTRDNVIAITGADMKPMLEERRAPMNQAFLVKAGETLALGLAENGCRSYIAFAGGLRIEECLGSKSTNMNCSIGGLKGRMLKAGDEISFRKPTNSLPGMDKRMVCQQIPDTTPKIARVVLGPQAEFFIEEGLDTFLTETYKLTNDSNRMACKLKGPEIKSRQSTDIISDGICLGSVQVASNGQPIIMLSDRQTTGGYAKIGTVISTDIPVIAQCKPGDEIRFERIALKDAQKLYKTRYKRVEKFEKAIKRLK